MKKALVLLIAGSIVSGVAAYTASAADPTPETAAEMIPQR